MTDVVPVVTSCETVDAAVHRLRSALAGPAVSTATVLDVFDRWSEALGGMPEVDGLSFLRLWLRRGTLEPLLTRELGATIAAGQWQPDGQARIKAFPIGIVGHWPAANVTIQPLLSMTCALLGGNGCLVRVPPALAETTGRLLAPLATVDHEAAVTPRIALLAFEHERNDLQSAMARQVDGAMIWGGHDAVTAVRGLPFPPWARLAVFGPRLSVAAIDYQAWADASERIAWCRRITRDVWQFDQQACSSPQVLLVERPDDADARPLIDDLRAAFAAENRRHARAEIHPALTAAICLARASWLLGSPHHRGWFPLAPDWTILVGEGDAIPTPTQGRTLNVICVADLERAIATCDGSVQALGLAVADTAKEARLAETAARHGIDRIVKVGRMHVFASPWDGADLIRPMVRLVRFVPGGSAPSNTTTADARRPNFISTS